jgi:hypothetical protein
MNAILFLIILISAFALIPLSDYIFNFLESNGILTKVTIASNDLSPRKIFQFMMFLIAGFSAFPVVVRFFIFMQIKIGNSELPLVKFLQAHEQACVIFVWCFLIIGLCIALPGSIEDFTID